MTKKLFFFIAYILFFNYSIAEPFDIRKATEAKRFTKSSYEINDTNLVDKEIANKLLENISNLNLALIEKGKEIKKKNENRKKQKFKGAEDIYADFADSVVFIGNRKKGKIQGIGSGFVVDHNGIKIITNWHVIDGAEHINVWLKPKDMVDENYLIYRVDSYEAQLIKSNKKKDLAMLEVNGLSLNAKPVKFGKFNSIKPGQNSFAIGHPRGLLWTFTSGMISQVRPMYNWKYKDSKHNANVIQTQVPINPGNSGGPLFNKDKELIGLNTFTSEGENLNFAIAVDDVIEFLNEKSKPLKKKKSKYIQKKEKGNTWIKKKKKKSSQKGSVDLSEAFEVDVNKNGITDSWLIDDNNNGIYELVYGDTDENGIIDVYAIDKNEDKNFEVILIDTNGNGNPDEAEIDENEDGTIDVIAYDYNEDGKWDKYEKI